MIMLLTLKILLSVDTDFEDEKVPSDCLLFSLIFSSIEVWNVKFTIVSYSGQTLKELLCFIRIE